MAFCRYCGSSVKDTDSFCNNCGARVEKAEEPKVETAYAPSYTYVSEAPKEVSKKNSILSMVFSIIGMFFSIFAVYPIAGFIFMVPGIVFTALAKGKRNSYVREAGSDNGFSRAGGIVSTIAIPVLIVFALLGLFITAGIFSEL